MWRNTACLKWYVQKYSILIFTTVRPTLIPFSPSSVESWWWSIPGYLQTVRPCVRKWAGQARYPTSCLTETPAAGARNIWNIIAGIGYRTWSVWWVSCYCIQTLIRITNHTNKDGLMQDRSNSIANALELLQSCTEPSISTVDRGQMAQWGAVVSSWRMPCSKWLHQHCIKATNIHVGNRYEKCKLQNAHIIMTTTLQVTKISVMLSPHL